MGNEQPHVHAELIKAWADGETIEYYSAFYEEWREEARPGWYIDTEYRIKPEPKPDVVRYFGLNLEQHGHYTPSIGTGQYVYAHTDHGIVNHWPIHLKCTFDGEIGKLKSAEVLNGK